MQNIEVGVSKAFHGAYFRVETLPMIRPGATFLVKPGGNGPIVRTRGRAPEFPPWSLRRQELVDTLPASTYSADFPILGSARSEPLPSYHL